MDIRQLNYFVQVADCGNYSLASQKLFVSQPALSKTIKNMEDELGFTFFYTYQRKQKLTDAGQAFYEKAVKLLKEYDELMQMTYSRLIIGHLHQLLKEYDELMQMTYDEAGIDKGHVNIGLSTAAGPALFGHIFPDFREKYPLIEFSLIEKDTNILKDEILRKDIDVAIIDLRHISPDERDLYDIVELATSDIVIAACVDNPLAKYESISYSDLDGKNFILYNKSAAASDQMLMDIKNSNARPRIAFSSSQWYLIFEMVSANIGVVAVPYYIYNKLRFPKITAIPIEGDTGRRTIGLIAKKDDNMSRACRTFIKYASNKDLYIDLEPTLHMI